MSRSHDWTTPCGGYAVRLTAAAVQQMDRECVQAKAVETGGVLVGHYTADESTAIITEALQPPKDSARGRSWFHRGVAGLRGLLANRWEHQRRTYYVGEWHYHPSSIVEPSGDDLAQMHSINADPRYRCREPIMVIIGQARDGGDRPMRAFVFPRGKAHLEFEKRPSRDDVPIPQ